MTKAEKPDSEAAETPVGAKKSAGPPPRYLFLDTQFFDSHKYDFLGNKSIKGLITHGEQGVVRLILPSVIEAEIRSHIKQRTADIAEKIGKFPLVNERVMAELQKTALKLETEAARELTRLLSKCTVLRLDNDTIPISRIQAQYLAGRPPFAGQNAKAQFPDGFAVMSLIDWCTGKGKKVAAITNDGQMNVAFRAQPELFVVYETLADYLREVQEHLATTTRQLDQAEKFVTRRFSEAEKAFIRLAKSNFEGGSFMLTDVDGDVDGVTVTDIELEEDGMDILALSDGYALLSVRTVVKFDAGLSYNDPDSGIWDGEDKVMLFQDRRDETRSYVEDVEFLVDVDFDYPKSRAFKMSAAVDSDIELSVEDGELVENYDY